jgi:ABC-type multidrug transport system fused ATPase/permease subunit
MTVGSIQAFVSYVTFMMWPIQDLARVFAEMQHAIASAERIFSLVDTKPEVFNKRGAKDHGSIHGRIEFDHVSFAYSDAADVPVIRDLSMNVRAGETIALVGPTGGGKTTIINLLCRFYKPLKVSFGFQEKITRNSLCNPSNHGSGLFCKPRISSRAPSGRTSVMGGSMLLMKRLWKHPG